MTTETPEQTPAERMQKALDYSNDIRQRIGVLRFNEDTADFAEIANEMLMNLDLLLGFKCGAEDRIAELEKQIAEARSARVAATGFAALVLALRRPIFVEEAWVDALPERFRFVAEEVENGRTFWVETEPEVPDPAEGEAS